MIERLTLPAVRGALRPGNPSILPHPRTLSPFLSQRALLLPCLTRFAHSPAASARRLSFPDAIPKPATKREVSSRGIPLRSPWPWHPLPSSSPDTIVEERLVFARPSDLDGRIPIGACVVGWLFTLVWVFFPDAPTLNVTEEEQKRLDVETKEKLESMAFIYRAAATLGASAGTILVFGSSLALTMAAIMTFRLPTRVAVIRTKAPKTPGEAKTSLRLTTAGHEGMCGLIPPREVAIKDCHVYAPLQANTLRMKILSSDGTPKRYSLDILPYGLDMRPYDFSRLKEGKTVDVVQSLNRVEFTFGPVRNA